MLVVEVKDRMIRLTFGEKHEVHFRSEKNGQLWTRSSRSLTPIIQVIEGILPSKNGKYVIEINFREIG